MKMTSPTVELYSNLQLAFDKLFDGELPNCLISLRATTRPMGRQMKRKYKKTIFRKSNLAEQQ